MYCRSGRGRNTTLKYKRPWLKIPVLQHWNKYTIKGERHHQPRLDAWDKSLGRPRGMGWRGRREGGSGWRTHVNPWLIHVNVWQKPPQYCKIISLQLIKINGKKKFQLYHALLVWQIFTLLLSLVTKLLFSEEMTLAISTLSVQKYLKSVKQIHFPSSTNGSTIQTCGSCLYHLTYFVVNHSISVYKELPCGFF